jgi:hypothetical protein
MISNSNDSVRHVRQPLKEIKLLQGRRRSILITVGSLNFLASALEDATRREAAATPPGITSSLLSSLGFFESKLKSNITITVAIRMFPAPEAFHGSQVGMDDPPVKIPQVPLSPQDVTAQSPSSSSEVSPNLPSPQEANAKAPSSDADAPESPTEPEAETSRSFTHTLAGFAKRAASVGAGAFAVQAGAQAGVSLALGWAGFSSLGPVAGSSAAAWMSSIAAANGGGVAAGSLYACCQSVAMGGTAVLGGGAVMGVAVGGYGAYEAAKWGWGRTVKKAV